MKRKLLSLTIIGSLLGAIVLPPGTASAYSVVPITAPSAVLLDGSTQRLVFAKTPHMRRAPASTTKILTSIIAMDMLPLNRVIRIPSFVRGIEPSKAYLRPGERYYVRDLIRAALISSANDAAEVLAVAAAGSKPAFASRMNRKAHSIGCRHSNFVNASGLPARSQYSTAYDMALIMKHAQKYSFLVETFQTKTRTIRSLEGRGIFLRNHNRMLWRGRPHVIGKTGYTIKARHCFVGHIAVFNKKVFVAMMGSHRLWRDLRTLIDYEFGMSLLRMRQNRKLWSRRETNSIQRALKRAGYYSGTADGEFGPVTTQAVKRFQTAHGIKSDGVVGSVTWQKLKRYL